MIPPAPHPRLSRLRLSNFRNYTTLDLAFAGQLVAFTGENGVGKTNILEAISLLSPGRGIRRAALSLMPRRSGNGQFSVLADLDGLMGEAQLATALMPSETTRQCRIDREPVSSAQRFLEHLSMLWLTPDQDGLFRGAAGDRRRFLDRLVLAVDAGHGARASAYEVAMRHRNRLLEDHDSAPRWLDAIEQEVAELGVAVTAARLETLDRLSALIGQDINPDSAFPFAFLHLEGALEERLAASAAGDVEDWFRTALREARGKDRAAGRGLVGPQVSDLLVRHGPKNEAAATCSTGEQKALLIGLVLAQARLIAQMRGAPPLVLLDEIAAHLDPARRAALFERLMQLGGQVFMTGTDALLFDALGPAGQCLTVRNEGVI